MITRDKLQPCFRILVGTLLVVVVVVVAGLSCLLATPVLTASPVPHLSFHDITRLRRALEAQPPVALEQWGEADIAQLCAISEGVYLPDRKLSDLIDDDKALRSSIRTFCRSR